MRLEKKPSIAELSQTFQLRLMLQVMPSPARTCWKAALVPPLAKVARHARDFVCTVALLEARADVHREMAVRLRPITLGATQLVNGG